MKFATKFLIIFWKLYFEKKILNVDFGHYLFKTTFKYLTITTLSAIILELLYRTNIIFFKILVWAIVSTLFLVVFVVFLVISWEYFVREPKKIEENYKFHVSMDNKKII